MITADDLFAELDARDERHAARPAIVRKPIDAWWAVRRAVRPPWPWTRVRWFIQRGRRGYSDRDVWSLDRHLARVIGGSVKQLRDNLHTHPGDMTFEEWQDYLDRIWKPLLVEDLSESEDTYRGAQEALGLFRDRFGHLWD